MAIIMRFFLYLILLSCIFVEYSLTINNTNYILCTSRCSQIRVSFSNPSTLSPECPDNEDITTNYDYASACGIEYRIDYDNQEVHIDFTASNDTGSLEDQKSSEFLVQTTWLGFNTYPSQPNNVIRKYACNTNNDCARKFYLNTINHLVNVGKTQLDLIKNKLHNETLLIGSDAKRRCIDSNQNPDKPSRPCKYGLCYARLETFELNEQQNTKLQSCQENKEPLLFSEIEHHFPQSRQKERELLEYRCSKNVCNRNYMLPKIQDIINEYTQWNPKDERINEYTQWNPKDERINEKAGNLSVKHAMSSYILVLFLILFQLFI